jgi:hypothetical protein
MNLGAAIASKTKGFILFLELLVFVGGRKSNKRTPQGSPSCRVPVGLRFALNNRQKSNSYECLNTH